MTGKDQLNRHDTESCGHMGASMAMEVAITALLASHPNREALAAAWRTAEDAGFMWSSDPDHRVGDQRTAWVQQAYVETLGRLRAAALKP